MLTFNVADRLKILGIMSGLLSHVARLGTIGRGLTSTSSSRRVLAHFRIRLHFGREAISD